MLPNVPAELILPRGVLRVINNSAIPDFDDLPRSLAQGWPPRDEPAVCAIPPVGSAVGFASCHAVANALEFNRVRGLQADPGGFDQVLSACRPWFAASRLPEVLSR